MTEERRTAAALRAGDEQTFVDVVRRHSPAMLEGWSTEEVNEVLGLGAETQRDLLHRALTKARRALEEHLARA